MKTQHWKEVVGAAGFAARAAKALELFESRGGPIPSQSWIAAKASSFLEDDVINQPVVGRWLSGQSIPDTPVRAVAFARALMVDPGWLVFGTESQAPSPLPSRPPLESPDEPLAPRPTKAERRRA